MGHYMGFDYHHFHYRKRNEPGKLPIAQCTGKKAQKDSYSFFTITATTAWTCFRKKSLRRRCGTKTARSQP